jgi:hypothetical protein
VNIGFGGSAVVDGANAGVGNGAAVTGLLVVLLAVADDDEGSSSSLLPKEPMMIKAMNPATTPMPIFADLAIPVFAGWTVA